MSSLMTVSMQVFRVDSAIRVQLLKMFNVTVNTVNVWLIPRVTER